MPNTTSRVAHQADQSINLFCLPSAGSSASMYASWAKHAPKWLHICPIEYPGHGARIKERLVHDPMQLTQELTETILAHGQKKFALFGHSLGTALIWRIVKELQNRGLEHMLGLIVISGRRETSTLKKELKHRHLLPRQAFIEAVSRYAGLPQELLAQDDVLDFFLPILRNDFHLNDFLMDDEPVLTTCPLIAIAGESDPDIPSSAMMNKWAAYSRAWLGYHPLPGDHFYLNGTENIQSILSLITEYAYFIPRANE
ncbi:MAG: thioesterase [Neisseriaceae bacterium]|nr:thioesterase [Neisseriaceae bacterium]